MNIQDEVQKIHHKFGVSEMANYKIEQFIENLIKEDKAEQLILSGVSSRWFKLIKILFYGIGTGIGTYIIAVYLNNGF
jgi:hypothetical protein